MTELTYIGKDWELLAEDDRSEMYEVDITAIYRDGERFILATASGCSCWDGDYDIEVFPTLDELAASIGVTGDDRRWQVSPVGADKLLADARAALAI